MLMQQAFSQLCRCDPDRPDTPHEVDFTAHTGLLECAAQGSCGSLNSAARSNAMLSELKAEYCKIKHGQALLRRQLEDWMQLIDRWMSWQGQVDDQTTVFSSQKRSDLISLPAISTLPKMPPNPGGRLPHTNGYQSKEEFPRSALSHTYPSEASSSVDLGLFDLRRSDGSDTTPMKKTMRRVSIDSLPKEGFGDAHSADHATQTTPRSFGFGGIYGSSTPADFQKLDRNPTSPEKMQRRYNKKDGLLFAQKQTKGGQKDDAGRTCRNLRGEVDVRIIAAVNLRNVDSGLFGDVSDPYAVARIGEQEYRTETIWNDLNPTWDESFKFSVDTADKTQRTLHLEILDQGKQTKADTSLGTAYMHLVKLVPNQSVTKRLNLLDGGGKGELLVEVLFTPSAEQAKPEDVQKTASMLSKMTMSTDTAEGACQTGARSAATRVTRISASRGRISASRGSYLSSVSDIPHRMWRSTSMVSSQTLKNFGWTGGSSRKALLLDGENADFDKLIDHRSCVEKCVASSLFEVASCILILLSTALNGAEVDMLSHRDADIFPFLELQCALSIIFFFELVLRFLAAGCLQFCTSAWNLFDLVLVIFGLVELLFAVVLQPSDEGRAASQSVQRSVRTLRVARNLRILRMMRFFKELREMMIAVCGSMKTLMWLGVLLGLLLYFFAIVFTSAVTEHVVLAEDESISTSDEDILMKEYGSLARSILSLFKAITNGVSWGLVMEPLGSIHWGLSTLYVAYIMFCVFAFMNAVTSVFVDNALRATQKESDNRIAQNLEAKKETINQLELLFKECDVEEQGLLSQEDLEKFLHDDRAKAYFSSLGLENSDAQLLFNLFETDEEGKIDIEDFVAGCMKFKGEAKAIDLAEIKREVEKIIRRLWRLSVFVEDRFKDVEEQVQCAATGQFWKPDASPGVSPNSNKGLASKRVSGINSGQSDYYTSLKTSSTQSTFAGIADSEDYQLYGIGSS